MWVYRMLNDVYVVGFFTPDGQWVGETEHTTRDSAAGRVHWLNGGEDGK